MASHRTSHPPSFTPNPNASIPGMGPRGVVSTHPKPVGRQWNLFFSFFYYGLFVSYDASQGCGADQFLATPTRNYEPQLRIRFRPNKMHPTLRECYHRPHFLSLFIPRRRSKDTDSLAAMPAAAPAGGVAPPAPDGCTDWARHDTLNSLTK